MFWTLWLSHAIYARHINDEVLYIQLPELEAEVPAPVHTAVMPLPEAPDEPEQAALARASIEEVEKRQAWIESISTSDLVQLPVGIMHTQDQAYGSSGGDNVEYTVAVSSARFYPEYSELTVFARIRLPQTDEQGKPKEIFFGSDKVILSHGGGIIGDARLYLLGDVYIPFGSNQWEVRLKGGYDNQTGTITSDTYVTLNCDGVADLSLDGELLVSRSLIIPFIDNQPDLNPLNPVSGAFKIKAAGWNDLLAEVSISPFMLASQLENYEQQGAFIFSADKAILDLSDFKNSASVKFPSHYRENGLLGPAPETWRGIFFEQIKVTLPHMFNDRRQEQAVSFDAYHMLIDNYGVSGLFSANNLIPLEHGRTGQSASWAYSVDYLVVELIASRINAASFDGQLLLPVADSTTCLGYNGLISEHEYRMGVRIDSTMNFPLWSAEVELLPNSYVELAVRDKQFRPKACLSGSLTMAVSASEQNKDDATLEVPGVKFQNMVLQTTKPYFAVEYMGYTDKLTFGSFPASVSEIGITTNEQQIGLAFMLEVGLMEQGDKGFGAKGKVTVKAVSVTRDERQSWRYHSLDISAFAINTNMGVMAITGSLNFRENDPVYGKGFYAKVDATFGSLGPIAVEAIFGRRTFKYWYVDGSVEGLKIQAGAIQINGFSGGASYRMSRQVGASMLESSSGLSYVPDSLVKTGVRAAVFASAFEEGAVALKAGFEITTTAHGGIARMGFFGEANVMKPIVGDLADLNSELADAVQKQADKVVNAMDQLGEMGGIANKAVDKLSDTSMYERAKDLKEGQPLSLSANIKGMIGIEKDYVNDVFHGELEIFITTPGNLLTGVGKDGKAGWAVFHTGPDANYLHIGTPTDPIGIKAGVGPLFVKLTSYFMVGDKIPGSPPPPPEVARILGVDAEELNYMRDENALGDGRGFAFGAHFAMDTGDLTFLILYARFQAGVGFDIMLKDYGETVCINRDNKQIGLDGWYANGQAYAYLAGELGIKIKLFFVRKKIPIIKGGAAVLLQAKAPNPFWMRGYVGGYYNLLGGLVEGKFRFKMELGEQCEMANAAPLGGIKIITSVVPREGDKDVDVFAMPQATFAMKVGEPVIIPEDDGDHVYRIILERFEIQDKQGKAIDGHVEWSSGKDAASFVSTDILGSEQNYKALVEVSFQEQINGVFQTVKTDGQKAVEIEERAFTAGTAPENIPLSNLKYAYPVLQQQNYYRKESNKGFIALKRGQDYLFADEKWNSDVFFLAEDEKPVQLSFTYNSQSNRIDYQLPELKKETSYRVAVVSYPLNATADIHQIEETAKVAVEDMEDNTMRINTQEAKLQTNAAVAQIERLGYNFRSSHYSTFAQKIKAMRVQQNNWIKRASDIIMLGSYVSATEPFDLVELEGSTYTAHQPLVTIEATLSDTYFNKDIGPFVYQGLPHDGKFGLSREADSLGIPPVRAIPLVTSYLTYLEQEVRLDYLQTRFPYHYDLPYQYKTDLLDLRRQIANYHADNPGQLPAGARSVLEYEYPFMREGNYEVELQYVLPDGEPASKAIYKYRNNLKFNPEM